MRIVLAMAFLVACDRGQTPTAEECSSTAAAMVNALKAPDTDVAKAKADITARCTQDRWTVEARRCLSHATSRTAEQQCEFKHLTQEQAESLHDALGSLGPSATAAMAAMEKFKQDMCACKDAKCAQDVSDRMVKWSQEQARWQKEPTRMTEADQRRAAAIGEEMGRCMQVAMSAGWIEIESLAPTSGPTGTNVQISGRFTYGVDLKVWFGGKEAKIVQQLETLLTVEAPPGHAGEIVDVRVVFGSGLERKLEKAFTYR